MKTEQQALITVNEITKRIAGKTLLDKISFSISPRQIITLIGPNGAGKTTLIHTLLGFIKPDSGSIIKSNQLRIGYMPQKLAIDDTLPLTVLRFLQLAQPHRSECLSALKTVGIPHLHNRPVQRLSGGETQRMLLARAILRQPQLLVLDEPVQGVDVAGQEALYHLIHELRDSLSCAILMVSHDLHLVMAATDEVICLNKHICCHGSPEAVSTNEEYTQLFGVRTALYNHQHDHTHELNEQVKQRERGEGNHA